MIKPTGPLYGKKIGILLASEFSDFQVYYLASYIGEYGRTLEFLLVDWVNWKNVRPNINNKGVRGMWDLGVDPMLVMAGSDKSKVYRSLWDAIPSDYDVIIIAGGHGADLMVTENDVISFLQDAVGNGMVIGSIGEESMSLITAGLVQGKNVTGNNIVDYMLKRISNVQKASVVVDDRLITARDTIDTPEFMRSLCKIFDPSYKDIWKNSLIGKTILFPIGEDYEDIELIVPTMEFIYRGMLFIIII